jgi:FixJ family two-component response regulator
MHSQTEALQRLASFQAAAFAARERELLAPLYEERAKAINEAKAAGATWRAIAAQLGMSEVGVQRAPGVDSPWNQRRAS